MNIHELRAYFHAHPELSGQEKNTSAFIQSVLKNEGIEFVAYPNYGIVATINGLNKGPVTGVRADMDALPINGATHACGHDGHMAILLTLAKTLNKNRDKVIGTIKFVFQPAEEMIGGAKQLIDYGIIAEHKIERMFALHLWADLDVGTIGISDGPIMATSNEVNALIIGKAAHGAYPQLGINAIQVATNFLKRVYDMKLIDRDVVCFGKIAGGDARNVIPGRALIEGTVRSMDDQRKLEIINSLSTILNEEAQKLGATSQLTINNDGYPTVVNNPVLFAIVRDAAKEVVGKQNIIEYQSMATEDFGYFSHEVPSCFFFVGVRNESKGIIYPQHHELFDMDEDALEIGLNIFLSILLK